MWWVQGEDEMMPPSAEEAVSQEEEAEEVGPRLQGTDIEQGNAKVATP